MATRKSISERFEAKYRICERTGCHLWTAYCDKDGYGMLHMNIKCGKWPYRLVGAHRVSWMLNFGDIPEGSSVLHKCDTPPCVNAEHLFLGTTQDNMDDMVAKGRGRAGEKNPARKLTTDDVRAIRRHDPSWSNAVRLAVELGVTPENVSMILLRKTWKHIA